MNEHDTANLGSKAGIKIETSRFPLIECRFPKGSIDDAEFQMFLSRMEAVQERSKVEGIRYVLVVEGGGGLTSEQRKMYADWSTQRSAWEETILSAYVTVPQQWMRGVITAMGWVRPRIKKVVVSCATFDEAKLRATEALNLEKG